MRGSVVVLVLAAATAHADPDFSRCCGTAPASLGPAFGKLVLGTTATPPLPAAAELGADIDVGVEKTGERVDAVAITISDTTREPPLCPVLQARLVKAWGAPVDHRWQSRAGDRGAELEVLDPPSCTLRFYRMVPAAQWLNTSEASVVPLWAIGKPLAKLQAALAPLEPGAEEENAVTLDHSIRWQDTSIDGERISLEAYVHAGRVTGVSVELFGDGGLQAWRRLNAMFGAPDAFSGHEDMWSWSWHRTLRIELGNDNGYGDFYRPGFKEDKHPKHPNAGGHTSILFGRTH